MKEEDVINGIGELSGTISDFGPTIVIIAVFIVIFIAMFVTMILMNKKQLSTIAESYKTQSEALISQNKTMMENILNEKKAENKELVNNYIESHIVFKNASKIALDKMHADRVGIYVFHNGNSSAHGFPFFKMSCVGEWLHRSYDLNCRIHDHVNMPLYAFSGIIEKLYNKGYFENLTDLNSEVAELNMFTGTMEHERIYMLALHDDYDNLAGFSMVKFKHLPSNLTIDEIRQIMLDLNQSIRGIIVDSKLQKKLNK